MKTILAAGGVLIAALAGPATAASASPATSTPAQASAATTASGRTGASAAAIGEIAVSGSGCAADDSYRITKDGDAFTAVFSQYTVSGKSITEVRKNCLFMINLQPPAGRAYKTLDVTVRGVSQLPAGITLRQRSTAYHPGSTDQVQTLHQIPGPTSGKLTVTDTIDLEALGSVPCGAASTVVLNSAFDLPFAALDHPDLYAIADTLDANFTLAPCA